jgi:hypothetical protein
MKEIGWVLGTIAIIIGATWSVFWLGSQDGYARGYCVALGGTTISTSVCNVNGKVVEVK